MKYFTEPNGVFVIKIPTEWQYKNVAVGIKEVSPFSFEPYKGAIGAFQISCYPDQPKPLNETIKIQQADTDHLEFLKARMDDEKFNIHLWYATVEDHMFMAKYIYDAAKANHLKIKRELEKVELALSHLVLISKDKRELAIEFDRYEKFMASLSASFDLKSKAYKNESLIELLIIVANQIDGYLRMAIVLKKQMEEKTSRIDIKILYQGENDPPVMERKIYQQAKDRGIIDQATFDQLELLYKERNKVVHRYIITDFRTRDLYQIAYDYECLSETVRLALREVEEAQFKEGIGIYANRDINAAPDKKAVQMLFAQVNDKHLMKELFRKI